MAGISAADLDVAALYDANSFEVLRQLEILGVCAEGEGGPYVEDIGKLRGEAVFQVEGAEIGIAGNAGTGAGHLELAVLGRAR